MASKEYKVWKRNHFGGKWDPTSHVISARTDKEAQAKLKRRFCGAGFSSMSLIALPADETP